MTTTLQPLQKNLRNTNLDILRGFALAGVLFVYCAGDMGISDSYTNSAMDEAIKWFKWIMVEGRMYGMLIFVFGIGFSVQLQKANEKGKSIVPVYSRRLLGLLLIGFVHAILLSTRDILMFYAIAGFALLPARNFSNRQLKIFMLVVFLILVTPLIRWIFGDPWREMGNLVEPNNFYDHLQFNWKDFKAYHQLYGIYVDMLFHFLMGFYLHRSGFFQKLIENKKFRRKLLLITFVCCAILGPMLYAWIDPVAWPAIFKMQNSWQKFLLLTATKIQWHAWVLSCVLLYISILISLLSNNNLRNWFKPLAVFGEMALSNYLIQTLILVPYALWFNKFNNMPPFNGTILFLVVFAFQLLFSVWWLKRYNFGPFEWLLRSFTYWKWQPMRKNKVIPLIETPI